MMDHVLEAGIRKLRWIADRNEESVELTPNQAATILSVIKIQRPIRNTHSDATKGFLPGDQP